MTKDTETCVRICAAIAELTKEEATSVTLYNSNPDFEGPNERVTCNSDWTNWRNEYFDGDTKIECLESAIKEKNRRTNT